MNIGQEVTLKKGTQIGAGYLKKDITGIINGKSKNELGQTVYRIAYGKGRYTHVIETDLMQS